MRQVVTLQYGRNADSNGVAKGGNPCVYPFKPSSTSRHPASPAIAFGVFDLDLFQFRFNVGFVDIGGRALV